MMDFNGLTSKNRVIYECMWKNLSMETEGNSDSDGATLKLKGSEGDELNIIQQAFNISNPSAFETKFSKAVSGSGDERKKILTLHSSSRCSLLCFYNIEKNPIMLDIEGKSVEFNYSTFEFKNPVIGYPSNMDVVLLSTDRKTVLFLESKFSEYYISASKKSEFISESYRKVGKYSDVVYNRISEIGLGINADIPPKTYTDKNGKEHIVKGFCLYTLNNTKNYLDGIKQMISHYVGIMRRLDGAVLKADKESEVNKVITKEVLKCVKAPDSKVYLGEILFDKFYLPGKLKEDDPQIIYKNYSELYKKLANILNEEICKSAYASKFKVLQDDYTYSEVMKKNESKIDREVLKFYGI